MVLEELTFLTSDYITKLQSSRQYGTGTKTEIYTPKEQKARNKASEGDGIPVELYPKR